MFIEIEVLIGPCRQNAAIIFDGCSRLLGIVPFASHFSFSKKLLKTFINSISDATFAMVCTEKCCEGLPVADKGE